MTDTWEPKTYYYIKLNQVQLKQVLGEVLEGVMEYKPRKDEQAWILEHVSRHVKYLAGNKVAMSIQITNSAYADYKMPDETYRNVEGVLDYINEEDFELAKTTVWSF